jgi:predicted negative regulator of RcsB-dependent stress response
MPQSRHPSSRRRPEEKKEVVEDAFVDKTLEVVRWSKANSQILLLGAIVLVVVFAGVFYYRSYRASVQEQAVAQLEQVHSIVSFGERESAKAELYQYLERFEGTSYALEARLMLGQVLLESDESEEAVEVLAPAVRVMERDPLGIQAAFLMAAAYEELDRIEEAERLLLRVARAAELSFQVREALSTAARLREGAGNFAGATQLYEQLLDTLEEGDPNRSYWEMRLAEVSIRS